MFEDVRDYLSKLCFWRLPATSAKVTAIQIDQSTGRVAIYYEFNLGTDGPYTGIDFAESGLPVASKNLSVGHSVRVRYRKSDPNINELDRDLSYLSFTQDL